MNDKLRIWLIHHGEPVPENSSGQRFRSQRLAAELAKRGHEVTYWCSTFLHHKKRLYCDHSKTVMIDGYKLRLLHAGVYESNHSPARYLHHFRMARRFYKEAKQAIKPDLILCSLPIHYCAYFASKYGKENKVPVVIDIRDYWPDNILFAFPAQIRWIGRALLAYDFFVTKFALKNAISVVSMMSNLLNWGLKEYAHRDRKEKDAVYFIGGDAPNDIDPNTFFKIFPQINPIVLQNRTIVNYIGTFTYLTHPMVLIDAAHLIKQRGLAEEFAFVLAGSGDYFEKCKVAAKGLDNVFFVGWVDSSGINALNSISSVAVLPSYEEYSFPNKTFAYLSSGLPIISSENGDLRGLLEKYSAGFYFDIDDPESLVRRLIDINKLSQNELERLYDNAFRLFNEKLMAKKIYSDYADYLEQMALDRS